MTSVAVSAARAHADCLANSASCDANQFIDAAACGTFGSVTRSTDPQVVLQYMLHTPPSAAKGLVVLLPGGNGDAEIAPDPTIPGAVQTPGGTDALARSAALFAAAGYVTVTLDSPEDEAGDKLYDDATADAYRVSAQAAADIAAVVRAVNTTDLPVCLVGTDRGAVSAVAQQQLGQGIVLANPLTSGPRAHVGPLQAMSVTVPLELLYDPADQCATAAPIDALAMYDLVSAAKHFDVVSGGLECAATAEGHCGADTQHGFLGVEAGAVEKITRWLDGVCGAAPAAAAIALDQRVGTRLPAPPIQHVRLSSSVSVFDGTAPVAIAHPTSSRGVPLSQEGDTVSYATPAAAAPDSFVYVVEDGAGVRSAATVVLNVDLAGCRAALDGAGRQYATRRLLALQKCRNQLNRGRALYADAARTLPVTDPTDCANEYQTARQLRLAASRAAGRIADACTDTAVGLLGACGRTVGALIDGAGATGCLIDAQATAVDALLADEYGQAPLANARDLERCQESMASAGRRLVQAQLKAEQRCRERVAGGTVQFAAVGTQPITRPEACVGERHVVQSTAAAALAARTEITAVCTASELGQLGVCATTIDGLIDGSGAGGCLVASHALAVAGIVDASGS